MGSKPWNEPITNADELLADSGGGNRDRTDDLLHAMQALSQLSYTPTQWQPTPMAHHPKCPPQQSEPPIISRLSAVFQTRQHFLAPHVFAGGILKVWWASTCLKAAAMAGLFHSQPDSASASASSAGAMASVTCRARSVSAGVTSA